MRPFFAALSLVAFCIFPFSSSLQVDLPLSPPPQILAVTASAKESSPPDTAWLTLTAESTSKLSPRSAQLSNALLMSDLYASVKSLGLVPSQMTTTSLTLNEDFDWSSGMQISRGFVARQSVELKVAKLEMLPELLDIAVPPPAQYPSNPDNNALKVSVSGLRFDLADR